MSIIDKWRTEKKKIRDLIPSKKNPRIITPHGKKRLQGKLEKYGVFAIPCLDNEGNLLNFNQRLEALLELGYGDETIDVRVPTFQLSQKQANEIRAIDNIHEGEFDVDLLREQIEDIEIEDIGLEDILGSMESNPVGQVLNSSVANEFLNNDLPEKEPRDIVYSSPEEDNQEYPVQKAEKKKSESQVEINQDEDDYVPEDRHKPSVLYPSNNDLDIPVLKLELQAKGIEPPVVPYKVLSKMYSGRTTHFYINDYEFAKIYEDPQRILDDVTIKNIVEPNYSLLEETPFALGLQEIYKKRWLARHFQEYGLNIIVDINVSPKWFEYNLMGIPKGWKAFASRGYSHNLNGLKLEYEKICQFAETDDILFIVYAGGNKIEEWCKSVGAHYFPNYRHALEGYKAEQLQYKN